MSKRDLNNELEKIVTIISSFPNGASLEDLHPSFSLTPRRTLQYRLSILVKNEKIKKEGLGRSSKYYANQEALTTHTEILPSPLANSVIKYSSQALEGLKLTSLPIELRPHVSYQRRFLDSYEPNKTFYLSKPTLEKLLKFGEGVERGRPAGTYARKIYQRLLIDLSWNSSRLEGNTYSLLETEKLLDFGEVALGKNKIDTQMILNHKDAIEFIVDIAEELDINHYTILNIHGLLSNNLLLDPKACGRLRTTPVKIGKSVYHPIEVPQLIEECFHLIIQKASAIKNPFEQSFFLMVHLPYLQPFLDVNKRVSRLAGNIPFIRENLSPLSFVDVPEADYIQGLLAIYELNKIDLFRDIFIWAYERSASLYLATLEALGEPDLFRVRYKDLIQQMIQHIVQQKLKEIDIPETLREFAKKNLPLLDQKRFIEIVEIEIRSLHEGNFARFRIRPSEFFEWQKKQ